MGEFYGNQHTGSEYDDYEYDDLIEAVRELAAELGEPPTTRDTEADERFPCLARMYDLIEEDWSRVLADAGVDSESLQVWTYDSDDREEMIDDLRRADNLTAGPSLTMREYDSHGKFATSTVKKHFGSWAEACAAAGVDCGRRHGKQCAGPNGNQLDSRHELAVAQYLDEQGLEYRTHVRVGETRWTCDFYIESLDLWVEVDGYIAGRRPNKRPFTQKLGYYAFRGMEFVVVESPADLETELQKRSVV